MVIAGIDKAIKDDMDVINLSLGSNINDPLHPSSVAINNAMLQGVVSIIAAGNDGPKEGTLGSPGSSALAITIGASDVPVSVPTATVSVYDADQSSNTDPVNDEEQPPVTDPGDTEKQPPLTDPGDTEGQPPITDPGSGEEQPPAADPGDNENQLHAAVPGNNEEHPSVTVPGNIEENPSDINSGNN